MMFEYQDEAYDLGVWMININFGHSTTTDVYMAWQSVLSSVLSRTSDTYFACRTRSERVQHLQPFKSARRGLVPHEFGWVLPNYYPFIVSFGRKASVLIIFRKREHFDEQ
jgi:hypothetical protein